MTSPHRIICAYCRQECEPVKSHIIPKGMYALGEGKEALSKIKTIPSDLSKYPKKSPSGIYGQFLCRTCEDIFMPIDDYAINFLQQEAIAAPRKQTYTIVKDVSGKKLDLFFISVLWKAHHAQHEFFQDVKLGSKHERNILEVIKSGDALKDDQYTVLLQRIDTDASITGFINPCYGKELGGQAVNHYVVCIPWFRAFIKVDQRNWPNDLVGFTLKNDNEAGFFLQDLNKSKELSIMKGIVMKRNGLKRT